MHALLEKYIFFESGTAVIGRRGGSGRNQDHSGARGDGAVRNGERGLYGTVSSRSSVSSSSTTSTTGGGVFSRLRQYASQSPKDAENLKASSSSSGTSLASGSVGVGGMSSGILGQAEAGTGKAQGRNLSKNSKPVNDFELQSEDNPVLTVGGKRLLPVSHAVLSPVSDNRCKSKPCSLEISLGRHP